MRWKNAIFVALLLLSASCTRKPERSLTDNPERFLIGEWKGTDSTGQTASLVINSDRTFKIVLGSIVMDGPTFGGKEEWRADTSRYPMTLDFVITRADGNQRVLPTIFRFVTAEEIQIRTSEDMQSHPTNFSLNDSTSQIVLTKQSTAAIAIAQPQPPVAQQSPQRDEFRDEPQTLYAMIRQAVTTKISTGSVDLKPGDLVLVIARNSEFARVEINGQTATIPLSVTDLAQQ